MPDTPSITIVKRIQYRGQPEDYSNTYHFSGTTPGSDAAWKTLADAIIAEERKMFINSTTFVAAYGYAAGNESSVAQINYEDPPNTVVAGSLAAPTGYDFAPGDVAFWVRWKTAKRSTKGRPVYLRKYFHGVLNSTDTIAPTQRTAAIAYAAKMTDGSLPGGFKVCGPQGDQAGTAKVPTFATTRTLKRRGKDPS